MNVYHNRILYNKKSQNNLICQLELTVIVSLSCELFPINTLISNLFLLLVLYSRVTHPIKNIIQAKLTMIMKMSTNTTYRPISKGSNTSTPSGQKLVQNRTLWKPTSSVQTRAHTSQEIPTFSNLNVNTNLNTGNAATQNNGSNPHDAKTYRMIVHAFASNINSFYGKKNKNALGELEQLYKIPLSKEEKQDMHENMSNIFSKHIDKFMRQMLNRNSQAQKTRDQYFQSYPNKTIAEVQQNLIVSHNPESNQKQKKKQPLKRPVSSGPTRHQSFSQRYSEKPDKKQPVALNMNQTNICYEAEQIATKRKTSANSCLYKFEQEQYLQIADRIKKNSKNGYHNNRYVHLFLNATKNSRVKDDKSDQIFRNKNESNKNLNSSINRKNSRENNKFEFWKTENFDDTNCYAKFDDKFFTDRQSESKISIGKLYENKMRNLSCKYEKRGREESEKAKIQEKILTLNTATSASVIQSQPQGYKPKSKCWGINLQTNSFCLTKNTPNSCSSNQGTTNKSGIRKYWGVRQGK